MPDVAKILYFAYTQVFWPKGGHQLWAELTPANQIRWHTLARSIDFEAHDLLLAEFKQAQFKGTI